MPFWFNGYELDEGTIELRLGGEPVPIEPQVFDVLRYLVDNRDRVVPKTELLDAVWGDQFVSESALTTCIKQARQAVGDNGRDQRVIKTSHGKGYRFIAVVVDRAAPASETVTEAAPSDDDDELSAVAVPPHRPALRVPLMGREADVSVIKRRIADRRLVTLVGMGGIGKTHLLRHLDHALAADYDGGSVLVELAPLRSGDALGPALVDLVPGADTSTGDPIEVFLGWLKPRRCLLLLDNAEHVASDAADLCRQVMDRCPGVDLVVTSRVGLGLAGESIHPVGPLELDAAVSLFVERAFDGGADLDPDQPELRTLCRKLDGVPLAIEIVAARAPLLSVADLTANLERHLAASHPAEDARHHTLAATLRWSLDDLGSRERRVLEEFTAFAGSFDLAAADAVASVDDVTDSLLDLCRRSLVVPGPQNETSRFRLLEPVRLFAAESTEADEPSAAGAARLRHAEYYRDLAARADRWISSHALDRGMVTMTLEWPNIRAAFHTFASDQNVDAMTELVVATGSYASARLTVEVFRWAERTYELVQHTGVAPSPELLAILAGSGANVVELERVNQLMAAIDPTHPSPHVRQARIVQDWYQGRMDSVIHLLDRALEEHNGEGGYWESTFLVLRILPAFGPDRRSPDLLDRLEALAATDGMSGALFAQVGRGVRLAWLGRPDLATVELDQAVATAEAFGAAGMAQVLHSLRSSTHQETGEQDRAAEVLAEWIERAVVSGGWSMAAESLGWAAIVLTDGGRADVAAQIMAARRAAGYRYHQQYEERLESQINDALEPADRAERVELGGRLGLVAAVELALDELKDLATTS
ncbi:MAG: winged helix-turn-helix domain-containing protein [Actinomycetota bacterium]